MENNFGKKVGDYSYMDSCFKYFCNKYRMFSGYNVF